VKVFGIDIIRGSVRSRTVTPRYALVTVHEGSIVSEESVSLFRLIRLVHRHKPDILAVDSIQEVAGHTQDVYRFIELLPPHTRFVSVTGGEKQTGLIQIAARFNITFNRFDPFAEARAIAMVAAQGAGVEVVAFEKETEIVVSRNRSPGKGGWSQNRYARKIHGNVLAYAREIEGELQSSSLDFWKKEFKAFGGVSRVVFHVREKREHVPVPSSRGGDVQVRISGKRLERIQFKPLSTRPRYLIVGIDPGTTVGIAACDLNGEIVRVHSSRQMGMSDVIEFLYSLGKPIIIASDVSPMPFSVEKIRRAFQAIPFTPRQDISVETKYEVAGPYKYGNDHERDAITAAIEASRFWKHKFTHILKRLPAGIDMDEVRAGLIRGNSLEQILETLQGSKKKEENKKPEITIDSSDERVRVLDGRVKDLRGVITDLQMDLELLRAENRKMKQEINSLRTARIEKIRIEPEIARRDLIIENLKKRLRLEEKNNKKIQKRLHRMKEAEQVQPDQVGQIVKVLPDLSRESIRQVVDRIGLKTGDVLHVRSPGGWGKNSVHDLAQAGVASVIIGEKTSGPVSDELRELFYAENIPLVTGKDVEVRLRGEFGSCDPDQLNMAVGFWHDDLEEFRREKSEEMLEGLFREYQAERELQVRKNG
jgi:predicted RNase H-like nuclease (RuvC/YqgF family)